MHSPHHTVPASSVTRLLPDEDATNALGAGLARVLEPGLVVYLSGDLGAGKTALTRAVLRGLGFAGKVKSPTYALVEHYVVSRLNLYHFDLYRFGDPREWLDAGFHEYFNADSACFVEWPEKAAGLLPPPDLRISLEIQGSGRRADITAETEKGEQCLERLRTIP
jgi:tRNA threonylcarbamoyladenosine biosynthesis protein TsaE